MNILKSTYNNFLSVVGSLLNTTNMTINNIQTTGIQNFDATQSYPVGATIKNPNNNILYTLLVVYVANTGGVDWNNIAKVIPYGQNTSAVGTWIPIDNSGTSSLTAINATYSTSGNIVNYRAEITYSSNSNATIVSIGGLPYSASHPQWGNITFTSNNVMIISQVINNTIIFFSNNNVAITNADVANTTFTISGTYQLS
jgi:hypothetical protein